MKMLFAYLSVDIFVFFTRYSLSSKLSLMYFIHRIVVIVHLLSLRNNLFVLARRIAAIAPLSEAILR